MKRKTNVSRIRFSKLFQQKLRERSAMLYGRELERWGRRAGRG